MKTLPTLLLACITMAAAAEKPRQPNDILILADTRALLPKRNPSFDPNHVPPERTAPKRKPAPR